MIRVAAGVLFREGRYLICRRRRAGPFPLKWEFPGGKIREGENREAALVRELREELGISVRPGELRIIETIRHRYPEGPQVELHFFRVGAFAGEPSNLSFEEIAWVPPGGLSVYDFLDADRPLVAQLSEGGIISPP